jgi:hypothetical protein
LDAAGYPRSSVLPSTWRQPAAEPLATARAADAPATPVSPATATIAPVAPVAAPNPGAGGIRF